MRRAVIFFGAYRRIEQADLSKALTIAIGCGIICDRETRLTCTNRDLWRIWIGSDAMNLHGFQFAYEIYPSREDDSNIQILLEIKNDRCFLLYHNRNNHSTIDITDSIDRFCKGLLMMNINEWHQKCFDTPWDLFPSFFWKLSISADDIYVVCKGIDNFPENWDEFKLLLREAGITDPEFPFQ